MDNSEKPKSLSNFIRYASDEEKQKVISEVIDKASEDQRQFMEAKSDEQLATDIAQEFGNHHLVDECADAILKVIKQCKDESDKLRQQLKRKNKYIGKLSKQLGIDQEVKAVLSDLTGNDQWISVKDGLPEMCPNNYSDWVLISSIEDGRHFVHQDRYDFVDSEWVDSKNVTYWMPLPTPPINNKQDG